MKHLCITSRHTLKNRRHKGIYKAVESTTTSFGKSTPELHAPTPRTLLEADTLQQPKSSPTETGEVVPDPHVQDQGESSPARAGHTPNRGEPHGHSV
jgi:hypothetical protein